MSRTARGWWARFVCASTLLLMRPASVLAASPCGAGNALAHAAATAEGTTPAERARLTDGVVAPEGSTWPSADVGVVLHAPITWQLAESAEMLGLSVQVDADQPVEIALSADGKHWSREILEPHAIASGTLARRLNLNGALVKFARVGPHGAANTLFVTEVSLECTTSPAPTRVVDREGIDSAPLDPDARRDSEGEELR